MLPVFNNSGLNEGCHRSADIPVRDTWRVGKPTLRSCVRAMYRFWAVSCATSSHRMRGVFAGLPPQ